MNGLITFRLGEREYATALSAVREVVRLEGLADLPGMTAPLAGVLDLRGTALPVMDLRVGVLDAATDRKGDRNGDRTGEQAGERRGDVLVLERAEGLVGIAVDKVRAVVDADALPTAGGMIGEEGGVLPSYVLDVLRGAAGPVFLVDLPTMLGSASAPALV